MKNFIINIIQYSIIWSTLFAESFKALSFSDAKSLGESISNCNNLELLQLSKGEAREYCGFSFY